MILWTDAGLANERKMDEIALVANPDPTRRPSNLCGAPVLQFRKGGDMSLTERGISTTRGMDQFATEPYWSSMMGGWMVSWDYRDKDGELRSGVSRTLEQAKKAASRFGYREN